MASMNMTRAQAVFAVIAISTLTTSCSSTSTTFVAEGFSLSDETAFVLVPTARLSENVRNLIIEEVTTRGYDIRVERDGESQTTVSGLRKAESSAVEGAHDASKELQLRYEYEGQVDVFCFMLSYLLIEFVDTATGMVMATGELEGAALRLRCSLEDWTRLIRDVFDNAET
jgi:hypothetical protein